jgi:hypothetical protein
MKMVAKNYLMVALLSVLSAIGIINWYCTGNPAQFFLFAHTLEVESENIEKVNVEFVDRKVYLNVHLRKQTTCKKIVADLGINTTVIGHRFYSPSCTMVNNGLIRIIYSERINV